MQNDKVHEIQKQINSTVLHKQKTPPFKHRKPTKQVINDNERGEGRKTKHEMFLTVDRQNKMGHIQFEYRTQQGNRHRDKPHGIKTPNMLKNTRRVLNDTVNT